MTPPGSKGLPRLPVGAGTSDSVRMYLREIGQVALLTSEQEVSLARAVQAGLRADEMLMELEVPDSCPICPPERIRQLERVSREGQKAHDHVTRANLRLVVSIAKRYANKGMPLLDLVQEGNLGLMRAVERFDPEKGFKFSTYATWWIRQAITRSIADQSRTIRLPIHMVETLNRILKAQRELLQELEREPTAEEVADRTSLTVERVLELQHASLDPLSLDSQRGDDEDATLGDFIVDSAADAPSEVAARRMLVDLLRTTMAELPQRDPRGGVDAVRVGGRPAQDPGGGRRRLRRDEGADPPDRDQDARQAAPPPAVPEAARLPRELLTEPWCGALGVGAPLPTPARIRPPFRGSSVGRAADC